MIKFVLMVNKQGQTRLAQYYDFLSIQERVALEAEIIRKCLGRNETQVRALLASAFIQSEWTKRLISCLVSVLVRGVPRLQGHLQTIRVALFHRRRQGRRLGGA
jgi:hypothetical protein